MKILSALFVSLFMAAMILGAIGLFIHSVDRGDGGHAIAGAILVFGVLYVSVHMPDERGTGE
jgi:hypothetical protein